jgi:hypothetical protein
MKNGKLRKFAIGTLIGGTLTTLAGLVSSSGCVEVNDLNTSDNPSEGRELTIYEGDVKDWTEVDSFVVESPFGSHPVGGIVTSYSNNENSLPPFNTRLTCEQVNPGEKDCSIQIKDNDIDHYTSGNVWDVRVNGAGLGYPFVREHLELTWMYGPSPSGVLEELMDDDGNDDINGQNNEDNGHNNYMSCVKHQDCHGLGNFQCVGDSVHDDFKQCVDGYCSDSEVAYGQFVQWCENGCLDGACIHDPNGDNGNSENGGDSGSDPMCYVDSDCGTDSETFYCVGNYDVHKDHESYSCVNGGCVDNSTYGQWQEWCQEGCQDGACNAVYQPNALERLVAFNSNFERPSQDGKSDIRLYWAEEQGESGNFVYGEFPELDSSHPVHYDVSINFMNGKYLIAVGDPDLVGDIGEVIRGTQSTTGMSSAIGGYNPPEAPDFFVVNPDKGQIPQEVFTIMAHGE